MAERVELDRPQEPSPQEREGCNIIGCTRSTCRSAGRWWGQQPIRQAHPSRASEYQRDRRAYQKADPALRWAWPATCLCKPAKRCTQSEATSLDGQCHSHQLGVCNLDSSLRADRTERPAKRSRPPQALAQAARTYVGRRSHRPSAAPKGHQDQSGQPAQS